ncbi:nuclear pore complex protein DDB_G0274915-like isoform X2 [Punica granatum]|uniref:Nuclear pore complex protein DDB_G0274915-like isoform X2 n=1 Tax=Punica granatum TaxID=22663 RepID=A0A6P8DI67_PUNGR|nr:nuclear pore complex protein DDB_G0274915-like isoform X2 [Punica granatum]
MMAIMLTSLDVLSGDNFTPAPAVADLSLPPEPDNSHAPSFGTSSDGQATASGVPDIPSGLPCSGTSSAGLASTTAASASLSSASAPAVLAASPESSELSTGCAAVAAFFAARAVPSAGPNFGPPSSESPDWGPCPVPESGSSSLSGNASSSGPGSSIFGSKIPSFSFPGPSSDADHIFTTSFLPEKSTSNIFNGHQWQVTGRKLHHTPTVETLDPLCYIMSISALPRVSHLSVEKLRWEYYQAHKELKKNFSYGSAFSNNPNNTAPLFSSPAPLFQSAINPFNGATSNITSTAPSKSNTAFRSQEEGQAPNSATPSQAPKEFGPSSGSFSNPWKTGPFERNAPKERDYSTSPSPLNPFERNAPKERDTPTGPSPFSPFERNAPEERDYSTSRSPFSPFQQNAPKERDYSTDPSPFSPCSFFKPTTERKTQEPPIFTSKETFTSPFSSPFSLKPTTEKETFTSPFSSPFSFKPTTEKEAHGPPNSTGKETFTSHSQKCELCGCKAPEKKCSLFDIHVPSSTNMHAPVQQGAHQCTWSKVTGNDAQRVDDFSTVPPYGMLLMLPVIPNFNAAAVTAAPVDAGSGSAPGKFMYPGATIPPFGVPYKPGGNYAPWANDIGRMAPNGLLPFMPVMMLPVISNFNVAVSAVPCNTGSISIPGSSMHPGTTVTPSGGLFGAATASRENDMPSSIPGSFPTYGVRNNLFGGAPASRENDMPSFGAATDSVHPGITVTPSGVPFGAATASRENDMPSSIPGSFPTFGLLNNLFGGATASRENDMPSLGAATDSMHPGITVTPSSVLFGAPTASRENDMPSSIPGSFPTFGVSNNLFGGAIASTENNMPSSNMHSTA